jgi:hypothetical protein
MPHLLPALAAACLLLAAVPAPTQKPLPWEAAVADAASRPAMTVNEAKAFSRALADYVFAHHLKPDPAAPQVGMVYEYFDPSRKGQFDQFVQGEALDTMHDGAWLAAALAAAARATGDPVYRDHLVRHLLPFYTKVLNHSDTLFATKQVDVAEKGVRFDREHALQPGEKGFCPYWWDDGGSVSLERRRLKDPLAKPPFACTDRLAGTPNPRALLSGYSHGSSNHLAQDLGPMLMLGWLLLKDSAAPAEKKLAADCALAAKHLQDCRTRHGAASIPAVVGPAGFTNGDAELLKRLGGEPKLAAPKNHYTRLLYDGLLDPTKRHATPGFADDMQYTYYAQLARTNGTLPRAVLFRLVYDCYTEPQLWRLWSDDAPVPPGFNRFDLAGGPYGKGGGFESYRSDRKVGVGSRFGPQNMAVCGLALQALAADPKLWDESVAALAGKDVIVPILDGDAKPGAGVLVEFDRVRVKLASRRDALLLELTEAENRGVASVSVRPVGADADRGPGAHFLATIRGFKVMDSGGQPLRAQTTGDAIEGGGGLVAKVVIPYRATKGQGPWMNGVELGRYTLTVNGKSQTFTLASPGTRVAAELERELAGGLRTWEAVFKTLGYVPTGLGAGGDWDHFSDSGSYAHLIQTAAQYVLWKTGRRDWEAHTR